MKNECYHIDVQSPAVLIPRPMTSILMTLELLRSILSYQTAFAAQDDHPSCYNATQARGELQHHLTLGYLILTDPTMQAQNKGQVIADLTPDNRNFIQDRIGALDTFIATFCR